MSVLDNNTIGTLESNIDIGEMLLPDNRIALVASFSGWCYPYCLGGVRLHTTFQGMGTVSYILVNGNNIFSQVCMLLGLGAAAYRIDDGVFLNVQQADVDTIDIVDGQEVERQHQAPRIIRFQKNKNGVGKIPTSYNKLNLFTIMTQNEEITEEEKIRIEEEKNSIDPNNEEDDSIAIN